jgi:hypothetical protein
MFAAGTEEGLTRGHEHVSYGHALFVWPFSLQHVPGTTTPASSLHVAQNHID